MTFDLEEARYKISGNEYTNMQEDRSMFIIYSASFGTTVLIEEVPPGGSFREGTGEEVKFVAKDRKDANFFFWYTYERKR